MVGFWEDGVGGWQFQLKLQIEQISKYEDSK